MLRGILSLSAEGCALLVSLELAVDFQTALQKPGHFELLLDLRKIACLVRCDYDLLVHYLPAA